MTSPASVPCVRLGTAFALAAALASCGSSAPSSPRPFVLDRTLANERSELLLNEPLVLFFSSPPDPTSVTTRSIDIRSTEGIRARGRFETEGRQVRFVPETVLAPTLDDGGWKPGGEYRVRVRGFPAPDGVRSADGSPLARGATLRLRVVDPIRLPEGIESPFFDARARDALFCNLPGPGPVTVYRTTEPIRIFFTKALRPDTVTHDGFALQELEGERRLLPCAVRLKENRESRDGEWSALVEVEPLERPEPRDRRYLLEIRDSVRDFSDKPVFLANRATAVEFLAEEGRPEGEFVEEFDGTDRLDPEETGDDGWAAWRGDGRVSPLPPEGMGDGLLGPLAPEGTLRFGPEGPYFFEGAEGARVAEGLDLHFTDVSVEAGATLLFEGERTPLLRAQGAVRVEGTLRRLVGRPVRRGESGPPPVGFAEATARTTEALDGSLIVVAGGDITVSGSIQCTGTLLLVAGGMLRIEGGKIEAGECLLASPSPPLVRGGEVRPAPIGLGPAPAASRNRLRRSLRYACSSRFFPAPGPDFLDARLVDSPPGSVRVRFFGAQSDPIDPTRADLSTTTGPHDDPDRLDGAPFVRFRIEFVLEPGGGEPWALPYLDRMRLGYRSVPPRR